MRVAVIGGGIAGVSLAYEVAASAEVVLFEQEQQLAHHTTGRSAAMYLGSYGGDVVRAVTRASRSWFDRIQEEFETPPLLVPRPLLWAAFDDAGATGIEQMHAARVPGVDVVDADEAIALCPALRVELVRIGALDTTGSEIDVLALHQAYVQGMRRRGAVVNRMEPVVGLERTRSSWTVRTPTRREPFDVVVDAAGAWGDEVARLAGLAPVGLHPLRRTLFTTPVAAPEADGWPLVGDARERFYFKPEGHGQLLVSPCDESPTEPCDAKPDELDIAMAIDMVNEHTTLGIRSVRTAWAGLRTFAADRAPVVGCRPGEDGFFWFVGQGGYGIQMAPALARAAAGVLLDGRLPADVVAEGLSPEDLAPDRPALGRPLAVH